MRSTPAPPHSSNGGQRHRAHPKPAALWAQGRWAFKLLARRAGRIEQQLNQLGSLSLGVLSIREAWDAEYEADADGDAQHAEQDQLWEPLWLGDAVL